MSKGTSLAAILNIDAFAEGDYLVMLTKKGLIKRTPLKAFTSVKAGGLIAIKLKARLCSPACQVYWSGQVLCHYSCLNSARVFVLIEESFFGRMPHPLVG